LTGWIDLFRTENAVRLKYELELAFTDDFGDEVVVLHEVKG
jgi:hypothetical protein